MKRIITFISVILLVVTLIGLALVLISNSKQTVMVGALMIVPCAIALLVMMCTEDFWKIMFGVPD